jgi:hypothetical protein
VGFYSDNWFWRAWDATWPLPLLVSWVGGFMVGWWLMTWVKELL